MRHLFVLALLVTGCSYPGLEDAGRLDSPPPGRASSRSPDEAAELELIAGPQGGWHPVDGLVITYEATRG